MGGFYTPFESFAVIVVFRQELCDTGSSGLMSPRYHRDKELRYFSE